MTSRHMLTAAALMAVVGPAAAQSDPVPLPYWASINVDEARMRKGPSPDVPVTWEYRRKDLPVKVVARFETWRKIEDPDGEEAEACWALSPVAADGSFTATAPDGTTVTVTPKKS